MTAVLAPVHKVLAAVDADDLDMDPALRACVQLALAGPHLVPPPASAAPPPLTVSALGMHLHTVAARLKASRHVGGVTPSGGSQGRGVARPWAGSGVG